ncbi:CoA-binding protein [uncultured Veillonella sp.]|uniref:CoA-binding protein n=1 Tax=uncultured Veillonella sp. TaxID=159268 RepID=UPI0025EBA252|nr:CoA-binding protein [uncultured Veillonella sp.]MDY3974080.1 CoA-binding protein [Veillonella caviae]
MNLTEVIQKKVWAVLGATSRKEKFGYKILMHLRKHGYTVYAVNPNVDEIEGEPCYNSLRDLPEVPDVVDFVVPEIVGLVALDECKDLGISTVWLQPGADKPSVVKKAEELGFDVIQDCVLVQIK